MGIVAHCINWDLKCDAVAGIQLSSQLVACLQLTVWSCYTACVSHIPTRASLVNFGLTVTGNKCFSSTQHQCYMNRLLCLRQLPQNLFWRILAYLLHWRSCLCFCTDMLCFRASLHWSVCLTTVAVVNATLSGFCISISQVKAFRHARPVKLLMIYWQLFRFSLHIVLHFNVHWNWCYYCIGRSMVTHYISEVTAVVKYRKYCRYCCYYYYYYYYYYTKLQV